MRRFYGAFGVLFKSLGGRVLSNLIGFDNSEKFENYLNLVTGKRIYSNIGKPFILSRSLLGVFVASLTLNSNIANAQCTSVSGTVFRDFNLNGVRDNNNEIGLTGVTVKAFNSGNAQVGATATTATDGTYSISGLSGNVRVEFSTLSAGFVSGPDGSTSGTSVQFVTLSSTGGCVSTNFGVNHPDDFCAKSGVQPKVAVPCYINGTYTGPDAPNEDAIVSFAYNKTGDNATSGNEPFKISKYDKIGSVWGMAYNKFNKTLFTTAFMKRHAGFGPQGIAGLYVVQNADNNGSGYTITGIDLETALGINAGTEPLRNFAADKTQPADDGGNAVFNAVGRISFGDCELSTDGDTLYITNLFDKKIYVLNVTNPLVPTLITSYLVPNPACAVESEYAPFGLKFYRGKLYVGVICTAQSSQPVTVGALYGQAGFDVTTLSSPNLKATVYELNDATFTTALTQFSLNFDRGLASSSSVSYSIWRPWVNSYSQVNQDRGETYPQPILSDIEFDSDGSMILGFADRFSHQLGNANYPPFDALPNNTTNGDFNSGNTGFNSDYTATTGYAVVTNSSTFATGASACTDKTSGSGNFLVANGPNGTNRVWYQNVGISPYTTFKLTFWATAINSNNLPQLYFTIDGIRVGSDNAAITSTTCNWVKYSIDWYSGNNSATTSAVFGIVNGNTASSSGGSGNDFGIDDISISSISTETGRVEGDVMRATKSGSTWIIENNGTASGITTSGTNKGGGPGGGEYYFGDLTIDHDEPTMGGLALYPGTGEIMTTIAGPVNMFYSGGTRRMNNNTGDYLYSGASTAPNSATWNSVSGYRLGYGDRPVPTGDYKLYNGSNPATFGKASGLGDIEVFCSLAPLEIGNRIWRDYDRDGIQDADEPGIPTITVLLFKGGVQIASTTTDANGEYYFNDANVTNGLLPNTTYEIRVATNQVGNTYLSPTNANSNNNDNIDSDASLLSGNAAIALTTGGYGESNHTYDIGFSPNCPTFANPQPNNGNVSICSGTAATLNLTISNVGSQPLPVPTTIQWVYFDSATANPYSGGTALSPTATLADGTVTSNLNFPVNTTASPINYYVYAILNPTPDGSNPNCRPSVAYIVIVNPLPTFPTSSTGNSVCKIGATTTVQLSASCATGTIPIWYDTQLATTGGVTGSPFTTPSISGTTIYYVGCKNNTTGCETAGANRSSVIATVTTSPDAPTISLATGSSTNYCGSGSATLNATVCATGTLTWSTGSTASSIIVVATSTPITYSATCVLSGCASSASNDITISTSSIPSTPTISGGNLSVCKDVATSLTATGCSGTYNWSNGGVGATISVPTSIVGTINYTVTCTVGTCTSPVSAGVSVTVNTIPTPPIAGNVQGGSVCVNTGNSGVVTLTAVCGANETPQWYNNNTTLGVPLFSGTSYSPSISATTTYYVSCRNNNTQCEGPAGNRTPVIGTLNMNPSSPTSGNVTPASRCEAGSVTLTAVCLAGQVPQWYNGNVSNSTFLLAGTSYSVSINETTTFFVGCKTTATSCETPAGSRTSVVGMVNPNLPAPASGQVTGGQTCGEGMVELKASCSTGQKPQWYNSNAATGSIFLFEGDTYNTPSISATTTYYVGCKDDNTGCQTDPTTRRAVIATFIREVDNGGQVAASQVYCGPSQPKPFTSVAPATGSSTTVEYLWLKNTNTTDTVFTVANETLWTAIPGATSATYAPPFANATVAYIRCARSAGCSDYLVESNVVVIRIYPIPTPPTDGKISKSAICLGESISLSATCGTNQSANWYEGTTFLGTGNLTFIPTLGGHTYNVSCQDKTTGCETAEINRIKLLLMVDTNPNPTITPIPAVCLQTNYKLNVSGTTGNTYAWSGSGFTSTEQNPTVIPTPSTPGTYTYLVTVSGVGGCTATATAIITVTPAVTNTANVTFCKGGKATLIATGGTGATYLWTPGGATTSSIEVTTAGIYNVTITDVTGCISKGIFTVTESAEARAIITGNTSLCASTSTALTVNSGVIGETYTWTGIGGFTSTSQVITVSTPGDYAVLVKTQEGCEGTAKVTVTAGFTPTAVCGPVCVGDSIRFSATQLRGLTYSWSRNGTFISSSADPKLLNVQQSDAGVYQVVITGGGCTATVVATLVVYDKPTGITSTTQVSTCDQDIPKNDGVVKLAGTFTGLRYDIVEGATYTGTKKYADATDIPANGIVKSGIANPPTNAGTKYTIRVFNGNNCYEDYIVIMQQVVCLCAEVKCMSYGVMKTKSGMK